MLMRRFVLMVALAAGTAAMTTAPAARAQPGATAKQRADAKRFFNQAHLAYQNGDYEEAILKWQQSYELSKEALIFESIANAYERLGDSRRALDNLKKWREVAPWREQKTLDSRIERLEERVKADDEEKRKKDEDEKKNQSRDDGDKKRLDVEAQKAREASRGPSGRTVLGWTLTGAGAGLVIAGVVLDAVAASQRPNKNDSCVAANGQLLCKDGDRAAIEKSNTLAIIGDVGWIVGSASTVAGVVVLLTWARQKNGPDKPEVPHAAVLPYFTPHGAGATYTLSF